MVLMEQGPVEGDKGLPMVTCKSGRWIRTFLQSSSLCPIDVDALGLYHGKTCIYRLYFRSKLFLRDGPRIWLQEEVWIPGIISVDFSQTGLLS